jgi:uncharacterized protein YidB (DUF937 family)
MGLLALLAYKAMKGGGLFGAGTGEARSGNAAQPRSGLPGSNTSSGGLGDWLGGLGGLLAGGAAGSVLTGGLGELVKKLQQNGRGDVVHSWVGTGPNQSISPGDLEKAVGGDTLDALAQQTGMPRDQLLADLSQRLPETVDSLTPEGRIPTDQEAARWA